jgi:hypothetical protein
MAANGKVLAKAGTLNVPIARVLTPAFANTLLCAELANPSRYNLVVMFDLIVAIAVTLLPVKCHSNFRT